MRSTFETANEAYEYMHNEIITNGVEFVGTKALFNIGFTIENPTDKIITNKESERFLKIVQNLKYLKNGQLNKLNIEVSNKKIKKNKKKSIF